MNIDVVSASHLLYFPEAEMNVTNQSLASADLVQQEYTTQSVFSSRVLASTRLEDK